MENASKALIMAGGVLITMLILTIGVILVGRLGNTADSYVARLDTIELQKYNSNFEIYLGRTDITAQEIVTVISIVKQFEQNTEVYIDGTEYTQNSSFDENKFLSEHITWEENVGGTKTVHNLYTLDTRNGDEGIQRDGDGKVQKIWFKKIS